jgi:hypothetical protein
MGGSTDITVAGGGAVFKGGGEDGDEKTEKQKAKSKKT